MFRGNETALKDQREERGPAWLWARPKDQKEMGRIQGKGGNSVGLGWRRGRKSSSLPSWRSPLRNDPSSEQSTRQKHLKYGWLSEFHCHNTFQGRSYVSSEVYLWGNPGSLKYIREAENVCSLQRSWKKCISRINISGTFGTHLGMAEICPVEGFSTLRSEVWY